MYISFYLNKEGLMEWKGYGYFLIRFFNFLMKFLGLLRGEKYFK